MEFLRFGSSIPGSYWGCCACCIIQNFKVDPDEKASIQLVSGDGGGAIGTFAGPTYRDIFKQRLRIGTFDSRDMPNHAFIAILTESQITGGVGKKWLEILKEHGFEFVRSVSNSVYTGQNLENYTEDRGSNKNYIFMLVRNIGDRGDGDCFTPPEQWTKLPKVVDEAWTYISAQDRKNLAKDQHTVHTKIWNDIGKPQFFSEDALENMGVPITYAGVRNKYPQESKTSRLAKKSLEEKKSNAFPKVA